MAQKNKFILPFLVGSAFIISVVILAVTDLFTPLVEYLHDFTITPLGALVCLLASILIFYAVYKLLVKLGESFLPEDDGK